MIYRVNHTNPAREVDLHGEDTDILGTGEVVVKVLLLGGDDGYGWDCHGFGANNGEGGDEDNKRTGGGLI